LGLMPAAEPDAVAAADAVPAAGVWVPRLGLVRDRHRDRGPCPDSVSRTGTRYCLLSLSLSLPLTLPLETTVLRNDSVRGRPRGRGPWPMTVTVAEPALFAAPDADADAGADSTHVTSTELASGEVPYPKCGAPLAPLERAPATALAVTSGAGSKRFRP
jgi:hypothetical protein